MSANKVPFLVELLFMQGGAAQADGEPRENNPFSPGSDHAEAWDFGWRVGASKGVLEMPEPRAPQVPRAARQCGAYGAAAAAELRSAG